MTPIGAIIIYCMKNKFFFVGFFLKYLYLDSQKSV